MRGAFAVALIGLGSAAGAATLVLPSVTFTSAASGCAPMTSLHYASGISAPAVVTGTSTPMGFNLMDRSSKSACDALPAGDVCLLYLGGTSYTSTVQAVITSTASDPKVWGYYVLDEPLDSSIPVLKQYVDFIHANAPTKNAFVVLYNDGSEQKPVIVATPANTDMNTSLDFVGLDPYPIQPQFTGGVDMAIIGASVTEALNVGWLQSQLVPVYQAFGGPPGTAYDTYTLPTVAQTNTILSTWASVVPTPVFDYVYAWGQQDGDYSLAATGFSAAIQSQLTQLQQIFAAHNACS